MRLPTLLLSCAACFSAAVVACGFAPCNEIACVGGFEWTGRVADGGTLSAGTYVVALDIEAESYTIECTIAATIKDSKCGEAKRASGEIDWTIDVSLSQVDSEEWDPASPVTGFFLRVADLTGSEPDGSYSQTRGPTDVAIAIRREDEVVTEIDYTLEYERDDEYRGNKRCGFCDELVDRTHEW